MYKTYHTLKELWEINNRGTLITRKSVDPTMAPEGKSVIISFLNADYAYRNKPGEDRTGYEAEKEKAAELVIF